MLACACKCVCIFACVWKEATRAVVAEWGYMMKFSGNLKSPIIEPGSEKKDGGCGGG